MLKKTYTRVGRQKKGTQELHMNSCLEKKKNLDCNKLQVIKFGLSVILFGLSVILFNLSVN